MRSIIASTIRSCQAQGLTPDEIASAVIGRLRKPTLIMAKAAVEAVSGEFGDAKYQAARAMWKAAVMAAHRRE
jgi:hypothetical protein